MTPEEFIKDNTRYCSNETGGWNNGDYIQIYHPWITPEQALRAVEIAKNTFIERAYEWLRKGGNSWYLTSEFGEDTIDFIKLAEDFKTLYERRIKL